MSAAYPPDTKVFINSWMWGSKVRPFLPSQLLLPHYLNPCNPQEILKGMALAFNTMGLFPNPLPLSLSR